MMTCLPFHLYFLIFVSTWLCMCGTERQQISELQGEVESLKEENSSQQAGIAQLTPRIQSMVSPGNL